MSTLPGRIGETVEGRIYISTIQQTEEPLGSQQISVLIREMLQGPIIRRDLKSVAAAAMSMLYGKIIETAVAGAI